jgi:DNA-binding transcriptional LysR family regulator
MREQFLLDSQIRLSDMHMLVALRVHGSARAVSRLFGASPALVSKAFKRIEAAASGPLFERTPGHIQLNQRGQELAERMEPLLSVLHPVHDRPEARATISTVAPSFLIELLLAGLLPASDLVQWRSFEMAPSLIASHLHGRLFSLALTVDERDVRMPWVRTSVGLLTQELFANVALAKRLGPQPIDPEVLLMHDFVMPVYQVSDRVIIGDDGCPIPAQRRRVGCEVETVQSGLFVAAQTDFLCFAPRVAARTLVKAGKLAAVKVVGWHVTQPIYLWTHADLIEAQLQKKILAALREAIAENE